MNFSSLMKTEGRCCAFIVTFFIYSEEMNLNKKFKKVNISTAATIKDGIVIKQQSFSWPSETGWDTQADGSLHHILTTSYFALIPKYFPLLIKKAVSHSHQVCNSTLNPKYYIYQGFLKQF